MITHQRFNGMICKVCKGWRWIRRPVLEPHEVICEVPALMMPHLSNEALRERERRYRKGEDVRWEVNIRVAPKQAVKNGEPSGWGGQAGSNWVPVSCQRVKQKQKYPIINLADLLWCVSRLTGQTTQDPRGSALSLAWKSPPGAVGWCSAAVLLSHKSPGLEGRRTYTQPAQSPCDSPKSLSSPSSHKASITLPPDRFPPNKPC